MQEVLARTRIPDAEQLAQYHRHGYVAVRQLLAPGEIAEIRETFMKMAGNGPIEGLSETKQLWSGDGAVPYASDDPLALYPRMLHPHKHGDKPVGPLSMKYMLHPAFESILGALLDDEPVAVQSMFYFKPPGSRGQALHQDNFYLRVKPCTCLAAWVAIDDADEENGGMQCVPNTQSYPIQCPEPSDSGQSFTTEFVTPPGGCEAQPVPLKAGDVLFFNGNVIHGSYPNRSSTRFRRAFICHYVPRNTVELSHWYDTPYRFSGELVSIPAATGGGPCGSADDGQRGPH